MPRLRSLGPERAEGRRAGHRAQGLSQRKRELWRQMVKTECALWMRCLGFCPGLLHLFTSTIEPP